MADDREGEEDVLELDTEAEEAAEDEGEEDEDQSETEDAEDDEDGETVIAFDGEEAAPASEGESSVIRELRRANREQAKRIAELETGKQPEKIEVGAKPSLESCDYDEERFETELDAWKARTAQAERQQSEAAERKKAAEEALAKRVQAYETGKAALKVADFDDAEAEVSAALSKETMALILHTDKAAELVYALSRSPSKVEELSKLNLLQAALKIGELKGKLQVTKKRTPIEPDRPVNGRAVSGGADKHLERLEKEAERTGDRTKIAAYKRGLGKS